MANSCKYYKQQKQVSLNSGATWDNVVPEEFRIGDIYEAFSPDCQSTLINRWLTVPNAFICENKSKYEKKVAQYSIDNGQTWEYYYPSVYDLGNLIEANADICHNKWEAYYYGNITNTCNAGYRYVEGRGCVYIGGSGGSGGHSGGGGWYSNNLNPDPVKYVRCSQSEDPTILTASDIAYAPYTLYEGIIGDCVETIASSAFTSSSSSSFTAVTIGDNVRTIDTYAFYGCSGLTNVTIPSSVRYIKGRAFEYCTALQEVICGNRLAEIGTDAFRYCSAMTSIYLPETKIQLDEHAWTYVETTIGQAAFTDCKSLTGITLHKYVVSIGAGAFRNCTGLTHITCNATTPPTLGTDAFANTGNCPIFVPAQSLNSYRSATNWSNYASRIQPIT